MVTMVEGIDDTAIDIGKLAKLLKGACASGGTVKGRTIELQSFQPACVTCPLGVVVRLVLRLAGRELQQLKARARTVALSHIISRQPASKLI